MSFTKLQKKIDEMKNPTVVGLDPDLVHIPSVIVGNYIAQHGETLEAAALAVLEFNLNLINGLCEIIPAVKLQSAYYELLGVPGVSTLKLTCDYARSKGMYVIMDAKRGDIGLTATAYSAAYLGSVKVGSTEYKPFDADALTVNSYLGTDCIKPFLETAERFDKAIFALVKTSNPSSGQLQDKVIEDEDVTVYTAVGDLLESVSRDTIDEFGYTRVGAVVGATYPEQMQFLRERLQHTFFLVPGYGAQGGTVKEAALAFDKSGRGAVVNSSRGIIAAWKKSGKHYVDAAVSEAIKMREEFREALAY